VSLATEIQQHTGVDVRACIQCRRCTSSCPVAEYYDYLPHQLVRLLQLGVVEPLLKSRMIWQCAACEACAERCPQGIEIARLMDYLRIRAQREGYIDAVPSVPLFYRVALQSIRLIGRIYELGLMALLYLRLLLRRRLDLRQLVRLDLPVGLRMLLKGKLPLLPHIARRRKVPALPPNAIAYYAGCSLHGTSHEYGRSMHAVFQALGHQLVEPEGWVCCGTTPAHSTDEALAALLPWKNIALYQSMGAEVVTMPCPSCYLRTRAAILATRQDSKLAGSIAKQTGADLSRPILAEHALHTIARRIGVEKVRSKVTRPLQGMRVVCYYGCAITRPSYLSEEKEVEDPLDMEALMEAAGCTVLDWSHKVECCGVSHSITQLPLALELTRRVLSDAVAVGAEAIVVACPLCHTNLDTRQANIAATYGVAYNVPVLYFTQVLGLAMGIEAGKLALGSHFVDPMPLLSRYGVVRRPLAVTLARQ
jgi:heterodisulfide reductase subunit B